MCCKCLVFIKFEGKIILTFIIIFHFEHLYLNWCFRQAFTRTWATFYTFQNHLYFCYIKKKIHCKKNEFLTTVKSK